MNWKIFILIIQIIALIPCIGLYLTCAAYFMKDFKSSPREYNFSMRYLIGLLILSFLIIFIKL